MGKKAKHNKDKGKVVSQVSMTRARKIFLALGFKTAAMWDVPRLQKKILKLGELVAGVELDKKTQKRVSEILRAQKQGLQVRVVDIDTAAADKEQEQAIEESQKEAKSSKSGKGKAAKKPGVVAAIVECLQGSPVSKKEILAKLVKKFPGRPESGMKRTINVFVPSRLINDKGLAVRKDKDGKFYIASRPATKAAKK